MALHGYVYEYITGSLPCDLYGVPRGVWIVRVNDVGFGNCLRWRAESFIIQWFEQVLAADTTYGQYDAERLLMRFNSEYEFDFRHGRVHGGRAVALQIKPPKLDPTYIGFFTNPTYKKSPRTFCYNLVEKKFEWLTYNGLTWEPRPKIVLPPEIVRTILHLAIVDDPFLYYGTTKYIVDEWMDCLYRGSAAPLEIVHLWVESRRLRQMLLRQRQYDDGLRVKRCRFETLHVRSEEITIGLLEDGYQGVDDVDFRLNFIEPPRRASPKK